MMGAARLTAHCSRNMKCSKKNIVSDGGAVEHAIVEVEGMDVSVGSFGSWRSLEVQPCRAHCAVGHGGRGGDRERHSAPPSSHSATPHAANRTMRNRWARSTSPWVKGSPQRAVKILDGAVSHRVSSLRFSPAHSLSGCDRCAVRRVVGCILHRLL